MTLTPSNTIEKLVDVFSTQIQELETANLEVLIDTRLANAEGDQLDVIGVIVGKDRGGAVDDRYRDLLQAQILLNLGSGTIPQIIEILELVLPGIDLELIRYFPAAFEIEADDQPLPAGQGPVIVTIVKSAKLGGVHGLFKWYETDPVFRLDGADNSQFDGGYFFATSL
jgi:hypothetical protein